MNVSIIIPVYNVAPYIRRCLQSVTEQTYPNIECILVDDCGNDNSIELAQSFIDEYKGSISFTILRHDQNKGQAAARNTGLRHAKGVYVFFLDSDDAITRDCIEQLMLLAIRHADADYVQGNFIDATGHISKYGWKRTLPAYCQEHEMIEKYMLSTVVTSACGKVIKRIFLTENNLYFREGIVHEDLFWSYFLTKHTTGAAFFNQGVYIYYINESSTMTSISREARIRRYSSRLIASEAFCADLDKKQHASRCQRHFVAGNLTCAMIELAALRSLRHWCVFWRHACKLYGSHKRLTFWQHMLFIFMMPPLCFPIGIKGWYWRVQRYIVNKI